MTTHTDNDVSEAEMGAPMKDWPAAIYKLAEQFGMDADSFKRHFVRELYSVGLDELAKEVRFFFLENITDFIGSAIYPRKS